MIAQGIDAITAAFLATMPIGTFGDAYSATCRPGSWEFQTADGAAMRAELGRRGYVSTQDPAAPWRLRWTCDEVGKLLAERGGSPTLADELRRAARFRLEGPHVPGAAELAELRALATSDTRDPEGIAELPTRRRPAWRLGLRDLSDDEVDALDAAIRSYADHPSYFRAVARALVAELDAYAANARRPAPVEHRASARGTAPPLPTWAINDATAGLIRRVLIEVDDDGITDTTLLALDDIARAGRERIGAGDDPPIDVALCDAARLIVDEATDDAGISQHAVGAALRALGRRT
jgi:hypothetical protein